jgi:hypothetical protein
MRLEVSKEGVFIPSFNGNKDLPATDQITVRYRVPTMAIRNRCRRKPKTTGIANANGAIDRMEIIIEKDDVLTLTEMLVSISGCSYGIDGKEHIIGNVLDLINAPIPFEPLYKEIVDEFDRVLASSEIDQKN